MLLANIWHNHKKTILDEHNEVNSEPLTEDAVIGKSAAESAGVASHSRRDLFSSNDSQSCSKLPDDTDRHSPQCRCLLKYRFVTEQISYFGTVKIFITHNTTG